jgi:hypothetical protein
VERLVGHVIFYSGENGCHVHDSALVLADFPWAMVLDYVAETRGRFLY